MSTLKLYSLPSFPAGPLPEEPLADDMSLLADDMSQGLVISSGGLGAVQGLTFTVTPYSETEIDVTFRATAISMNDMDIMDKFMQNALTASKYNSYKTSAEASASGSWSLFGGPTAEASAKVTHDAMSGYGLSEAQQKEVLQLVAGFFPKPSTFKFKTTIKNTSPNALSGQFYIYAFTGDITVDQHQESQSMVGGPVAQTTGGENIPMSNKTYT
jgi:hypothetical protein